jgi:hypothetical protein
MGYSDLIRVPELWDEHAAQRIVQILLKNSIVANPDQDGDGGITPCNRAR